MSIIGNALTSGAQKAKLVLASYGGCMSKTGANTTQIMQYCDGDYFTLNATSEYVCQKAGNYTLHMSAKSEYESSKTVRNAYYRIAVNGVNIIEVTTSDVNSATQKSATVHMNVGDVLLSRCMLRGSGSSSLRCMCGYSVEVA